MVSSRTARRRKTRRRQSLRMLRATGEHRAITHFYSKLTLCAPERRRASAHGLQLTNRDKRGARADMLDIGFYIGGLFLPSAHGLSTGRGPRPPSIQRGSSRHALAKCPVVPRRPCLESMARSARRHAQTTSPPTFAARDRQGPIAHPCSWRWWLPLHSASAESSTSSLRFHTPRSNVHIIIGSRCAWVVCTCPRARLRERRASYGEINSASTLNLRMRR